ncbi:hypothetical protein CKF54_04930 [Psittacicella hinzii]|uniref:Uncharacterized protein n=1 Tax=Psittacicella hinzii TaxID=2028575 RepID=A0A3A1Y8G5_9GAMM|nr:Ppx/GppA phosphatase family protein [Psittacicella hinzii]RIY32407.1 hypothetical protein CKF54_04930 [Psittacicella hinzii]
MSNSKSPAQEYIAVIDLGSNSFNLIIARKLGLFRPIIKRFNITVQLAKYLNSDNFLLPEGIERCCNALKSIQEFISHFEDNIEVRANATYTIRSTKNQNELLAKIKEVFPHKINILSGVEEASTIFQGIALSNPITERFVAVDIGGGSTEIILSDNLKPQFLTSKNLGCVSFTQKYFNEGIISRELFDKAFVDACNIFREELDNPIVQSFVNCKHAVGSSGTIKNTLLRVRNGLKDVDKRLTYLLENPREDHQLYNKELILDLLAKVKVFQEKYHNQNYLNAQSLDDLLELILLNKSSAQLVYHGFDASGRLVLIGGLVILKALFATFHFEKLTYSDSALREGILYSDHKHDIFRKIKLVTVQNLRHKFKIVNKLFNDFYHHALVIVQHDKFLQQEFSSQDIYNYCVFMLVGHSISDDDFVKHSSYIINNSTMYGFSSQEISQINQFLEALNANNCDYNNPINRLALLMELAYDFTFSSFNKLIKQSLVKVYFSHANGLIDKLILAIDENELASNPYISDNLIRINKTLDKFGLICEIKSL